VKRTSRIWSLLAIDEERIAVVVELFKRYADRGVSFAELGSLFGLAEERVREILATPVDDELWEHVCAIGQQHKHGGGPAGGTALTRWLALFIARAAGTSRQIASTAAAATSASTLALVPLGRGDRPIRRKRGTARCWRRCRRFSSTT
jgi:hypothetical protein